MSDIKKPDWFKGIISNNNPDETRPINVARKLTEHGPYRWSDIINRSDDFVNG